MKLDPKCRIDNVLINKYYKEYLNIKQNDNQYLNQFDTKDNVKSKKSEFHKVFSNQVLSDKLYLFLQNIYHLYPEGEFFTLINNSVNKYSTQEKIYNNIQENLPKIKAKLSDITY
jgi:hypothetical protein